MNDVLKGGPDALAALLAYVARVRDEKLSTLRAAAEAECRAVLGAARAKARAGVRQALREARQDADARIAVARAAAQARLRRERQALTLVALDKVGVEVESALRARWSDRAARARWTAMAVAEAARSLPPGVWTVVQPPEVPPLVAATLPEGVTLTQRSDPGFSAGLRISCGEATLDATAEGLLRDREHIAALWLGELERQRPEAAP